ncbi:MAG: sulfatase/phosphatase domain-containing protein [Planctomycetota bacterium]
MYDESMRMPLVVRYPGVAKSATINDDLVVNVDFAPTLLDLAGIDVPEWMRSRRCAPLLRGWHLSCVVVIPQLISIRRAS